MKKIFTLIVALVATVFSANAEEITIWEGEFVSTGWSSAMQNLAWGGYDWTPIKPETVIRLYATPNAEDAQICVKHGTGWGDIEGVTSFPYVTADKASYDFTLTESGLADICSNSGVVISGHDFTLTKVTLITAQNYQAPKDITSTMDQWGNILAKEFNGFSDDAKVEFTWNSTNVDEVIGWGVGSLQSIDKKVETGVNFIIKKEGDNSVSVTLGELKTALDAGPDDYNRYGLYWNIYPQKNSVNTRVSVKIYEVEGFEGEGYLSPDSKPEDLDHIDGYKDPVDITDKMDEYGNIESMHFNGFSDDAIILFIWESTGTDGKVNWGAGSLGSIAKAADGKTPIMTLEGESFTIKNEGTNNVKRTLGEIKNLLNVGPDEYNRYGLNWNMWSFDGCTNTRVSVKVFEKEGFNGDGYAAPDANSIQNVSTESSKAVKAINNGRIVISNNGNEYNVAGQLTK